MSYRSDTSDLVTALARHGVTLRPGDGRLRLAMPWPPDQAPEAVRPLLRELKARKVEALAYLIRQTTPAPPALPEVLPVQVGRGARPHYGPTNPELEAAYLRDERVGMKLLH
ncbi:MAG: hypothetical protein M0Z41_13310 [Peptococcaceae bacterium]|jgi:hypothetical protein|nr:hypothetical protein [Peptococcaceae bacterium]